MKIIFDIEESLYFQLKKIVDQGGYSSISSFANAAFENQLNLAEELKEGTVLNSISSNVYTSRKNEKLPKDSGNYNYDDKLHSTSSIYDGPIYNMPEFCDIDTFSIVKSDKMWLWGQINKIFPVKYALRMIVNKINTENKPLSLLELQTFIAKEARKFGLKLLSKDKELSNRRDEALSIAFPVSENEEKSIARFTYQYTVHNRSDDKFSGALIEMRFVGFQREPNGNILIAPTKHGIEFAKIINSVMDNGDFSKTLSHDEAEFYIDFVKNNLPGEYILFKMIASLLSNKVNTRNLLNSELSKVAPKDWNNEVINTQRSGAMSRMFEIGLIEKNRIRNTVIYELSDFASKQLK